MFFFFLQNLVEEELLALNNTSVLLANANATLNDTRNVLITGNSIFEVISRNVQLFSKYSHITPIFKDILYLCVHKFLNVQPDSEQT